MTTSPKLMVKKAKNNTKLYGCKVVLLGCTELSLANEKAPDPDVAVIDPQSIIADVSIELEEKIRNGMDPKEAVKKYMYD
ncbi:Aspartate racemase [Lactobacillus helveticus]|nr:Aspartate racemase [Lactobacillus helveticus]NRO69681.1 Aspartate racemase [Lactobacillus helveticus]